MTTILDSSIQSLPHTSPRTMNKLHSLNIASYRDLLEYVPFRYDDFSTISPIGIIQEGETVTIKGTVTAFTTSLTRRKLTMQKATISDDSGSIDVTWYNQPYLKTMLVPGVLVSLSGTIERFAGKITCNPVDFEVISHLNSPTLHTGRIVPIYSQTYGLSTKTIRDKMTYALELLDTISESELEFFPQELRTKYGLIPQKVALQWIHGPKSHEELAKARKRLAFNELFVRILSSHLVKAQWRKETVTKPLSLSDDHLKSINRFIESFPFKLTNGQTQAIQDILSDLSRTIPMNRFVQGDVGSGKTVVAAIASYVAYLNGVQTLIMAPTEILAKQHFNTISKLMKEIDLKIGIQTGSEKSAGKDKSDRNFDILVGTQALITQTVNFERVGLVVVDEQHRFGVKQRAMLKEKGMNPHLLTMTATPIPRTVSLTLYSELDMSIIDELPPGRKPIKTYVTSPQKREKGYEWIKEQIKSHHAQVYIICPLVEESESETLKSVRAATAEYEHLAHEVFSELSVGLLHGKMKPKEKEETMKKFCANEFDILVATSVVEVGVDVPNATIMIIEGAERYGIAQLHQLRGRVGRSDRQSYCFLFPSHSGALANERLNFFASTNSGLKLAEYDLKQRGPGDVFGTQQHGYSDLRFADITNYSLVSTVQKAVAFYLSTYSLEENILLKTLVDRITTSQISRD